MVIHERPIGEAFWRGSLIQEYSKPRTQAQKIAVWLGSNDLRSLLAAMEALERRKDQSNEILQSLVQYDAQEYRRAKHRFRILLLIATITATLMLYGNALHPGAAANIAIYLLIPAWLTAPFFIAWYESCKIHRTRLCNTVTLLHRNPPLAATGELIEAMDAGDSKTAFLAEESLTRLLPQITEADGNRLHTHHHAALQRALRGRNSALILEILRAYERIGDYTMIPTVQRLTKCPVWIADCERIQATAQKTLSVLQSACEKRQVAQTSLRAVAPCVSTHDWLLRPVNYDASRGDRPSASSDEKGGQSIETTAGQCNQEI